MKRAKPKKKKKKTWSSLGGVSSIITSKELSKTMIS
jgi:hypothetical protein